MHTLWWLKCWRWAPAVTGEPPVREELCICGFSSHVFVTFPVMYLRLLLLCVCRFSCYVFVTSPHMYFQLNLLCFLRNLLLCIFNSTCYVFATSPLMYFQLHLLCICISHGYYVTIFQVTISGNLFQVSKVSRFCIQLMIICID